MATPTIYLDNNATTRLDPQVLDAMLPFLREHFGNASSRHHVGAAAAAAVSAARRAVAQVLGAQPGEVVFTSGGTEADNLAIRGAVRAAPRPRHVVTTAVEHPAVLETCEDLAHQGDCELTVLGVDAQGGLDLEALQAALRPGRTCLVSAMWANNETGVLFPIGEIGARARAAGALFHVDAVQAAGKLPIDFASLPVDLLSVAAHKLHGPKGSGALLVRRGVTLAPMVTGGGQEQGRRSGTLHPAAAVGLARALELAVAVLPQASRRMAELRDLLQQQLAQRVPGLQVTGEGAQRLPTTLHVTLEVEAEALLLLLDREGVAASAGSACSSGAHLPSPVLTAMGVAPSRAHGGVRFSLSRETTRDEIERVVRVMPPLVERLAALARTAGASSA
jgi:cysteine desulfurase